MTTIHENQTKKRVSFLFVISLTYRDSGEFFKKKKLCENGSLLIPLLNACQIYRCENDFKFFFFIIIIK